MEPVILSLSPNQLEEFITKASLGFDLRISQIQIASKNVVSLEVAFQNPKGVRFRLSSGILEIYSNQAPKASSKIKLGASVDSYIRVNDSEHATEGVIHFEFNHLDFLMDFSVNTSIREILDTF